MIIKKICNIILLSALVSGFGYNALADEPVHPQLGASYVKLTDGTKSFTLSLSARIDDKRVNIENAPLTVFAVNESGRKQLGSVNTNRSGKAVLNVSHDQVLPTDKDGCYNFEVQYAGNAKIGTATRTIRVLDAFLEMSFSEKDSTKNILVKVMAINNKGEKVVVKEVPVDFYIKRLFCLYRFGGEKTDSAGVASADFPKNMPGDTTGKVVIVAKILESDTYGTVELARDYKGGSPLVIEHKAKRGLGDTDAPLWMVYTLLVLLSGVWCHVIYVISLVIRINLAGKRARRNPEPVQN
ncbi:MAG: hypothetical protein WCO44_09115 [Bacteroidota bacterium]